MNTVNNFEFFKRILNFKSSDEFYFLQIIKRGKDNKTGHSKNHMIKFYTVTSLEQFNNLEPEIIALCDLFNARAYIHPTKRSFQQTANEVLRHTTNVYLDNPIGLKNVYTTVCGKFFITSDKKFIIDLDGEDADKCNEIVDFIEHECEPYNTVKFQYMVPTVHGVHLITRPFNIAKFKNAYPNIDIHKNNPTLLYYKDLSD